MCPSDIDGDLLDELTAAPPRGSQAQCATGRWLTSLEPALVETIGEAVRRGASWQVLSDKLTERGLEPPQAYSLSRHFRGRCKCPTTS